MTDIDQQLKNVDKALLDITQFMDAAAKAEAAMNRLQKDHARVAPPHDLNDAEIAAVKEELRKAGLDPDALEGAK